MTRHKHLKTLIRARMARTGESYTTARRHVIAQRADPPEPVQARHDRHADSAVLAHVFAANQLPHDEALLFGLGGGAGFLSMVFDYAGHAPMFTAVMRRWSMSHEFAARAMDRAGVRVEAHQTGGAKSAHKALDAALAAGAPFICAADIAALPHHGMPSMWKGACPQLVGVFGPATDADDALDIEDHGRRHIDRAAFAEARAAHRKSKNALYRVSGPVDDAALNAGIRAALSDHCAGMLDPQMGHFQNNFGVRGIRTLADQLADTRTKKGLPRRFDAHRARLLGRLYESVRQDWSGPGALRDLQAEFLAQAQDRLSVALPVEQTRSLAAQWEAFAQAAISGCGVLDQLKAAIDARVEGLWAGVGSAEMVTRRAAVEAAMTTSLGWDDARWQMHLARLSAMLVPIAAAEEGAAQAIRAVISE